MIERIVVGVDGSVDGWGALRWTLDLAAGLSAAEVVVVHAVGLVEGGRGGHGAHVAPGADHPEPPWGDDTPPGVHVERVTVPGDPVSVLLRVAGDRAADLVVVGSRGVGGRPDLLLGSTSAQVAQRSTVPVVIVPGTARRVPVPGS